MPHNICTYATLAAIVLAVPAQADVVTSQSDFIRLVSGKTLTRPLIRIEVRADGRITGTGAAWEVTGTWNWQGNYFCRDLYWGGDPLGYNCQEVRFEGGRIRFTSDKGRGDTAAFRLN
ncbi:MULTISPECIES: dihydrodipicolinate reductase [Roseobacteraceae]|uniref:Dihydrodipicolinate reductase n=1 Tax=Pseudosulfitobacter pseudonitzschiae TaxID=1402135 RepID=A0A221K4A0_9RHOB|nr:MULTISPECIES: dihydrodipicolinate reductase [Roseobacteraceae]ASM73700.1 dihydrodipicolinate reductase [Pseudosulfitobacter pseudonitzschiae]